MLDEKVPTQYGPLGRLPALAAQLVIYRAGVAAIIALDTVHLTLGLRLDRATTIPPSQTPSDRWYQLRMWLLGSLDDTTTIARRLPLPLEITAQEQRTIDQLLGAAGNFLLAESRTLSNQIDTWLAVEFDNEVPRRRADDVSRLRADIITANTAAQTLLRMVGTNTWQEAICPEPEVAAEPQPSTQVLAHGSPQGAHVVVAMPYGRREPAPEATQEVGRAVQVAVDSVWRQFSQSVVVIVDCSSSTADTAANSVIAWAENLVARNVPLNEIILSEVVVTAVDGRQTSPIALEYEPSRRLRAQCRDAIATAVKATALRDQSGGGSQPLLDQSEDDSPNATHLLERTEDVASALAFAADVAEPHQILVVSDLLATTHFGFDAVSELFASSDELQDHFRRLRDSSLSFAEIAVTVMPLAHPASPQLWRALCGDNANLSLLNPPDHTSHAHNTIPTENAIPAVTRKPCVAAPKITVLVDFSPKPPQRARAKTAVLVLTITLALALVGAGAGFLLAKTGAGATAAASGVLMALGGAGFNLLLLRSTESVTALRAMTRGTLCASLSTVHGTQAWANSTHNEVGTSQRSLV